MKRELKALNKETDKMRMARYKKEAAEVDEKWKGYYQSMSPQQKIFCEGYENCILKNVIDP